MITATWNHPGVKTSARFLLQAPVIYAGVVPFVLLDLFITAYQRVCFPGWGIPLVRRGDYLLFDRARLPYLTWYQRVNCYYCSYANGLAAYLREVAARTEQYWCPIRHASPPPMPHTRYHHFLPFGDAASFHRRADDVSQDFSDLQ